ncbi:MAG: beta-aspartyl-peptidase [Thermoprotei archaeon]|jgi:beta-aspartyl-dipeptidase (metallo-type)|nr:beta-aspartyl-peptidase [Thermoprotei archaeon]
MSEPLIIRGGKIYSPEYVGKADILSFNKKVASIKRSIDENEVREVLGNPKVINAEGCLILPGIIDQHVHINGAGGEGGPLFRTAPIKSEDLLKTGITTVVGLLGTDGITRSLKDLLMKARQLSMEGITAYIYTGSYQIPSPTITGSVVSDIILINEVIGVKISLSDHRSSHPSKEELLRLASEARVGGILSGKAGVVHIHMGEESSGFTPILEITEETGIPITQFAPTHVNRSHSVLESSLEFGRRGGYLDVTTGVSKKSGFSKSVKPSEAVSFLIKSGIPVEKITMSSDGNGSMPEFDEGGNLLKVLVSPVDSMLSEFKDLVTVEKVKLEDAVRIVSTNVAHHLMLHGKGKIEKGSDADFIVLGEEDLDLKAVISGGEVKSSFS